MHQHDHRHHTSRCHVNVNTSVATSLECPVGGPSERPRTSVRRHQQRRRLRRSINRTAVPSKSKSRTMPKSDGAGSHAEGRGRRHAHHRDYTAAAPRLRRRHVATRGSWGDSQGWEARRVPVEQNREISHARDYYARGPLTLRLSLTHSDLSEPRSGTRRSGERT